MAYTVKVPRPAPVLGPYKVVIERRLAANAPMPRKQRYTAHKIFEVLPAQGYAGLGLCRNFCAMTETSCQVWRLCSEGVELFGWGQAFCPLLDRQLFLLQHVHEFDADERGRRGVK
jgi:hypothetical protein